MLLLVVTLVRRAESFNIKYRNTRFNAHMSKSKMRINVKFLTASCYCSWAHLLGDDYLHYIRPCGMGSELLSVF